MLKNAFALGGLIFDLAGAFLLALPMLFGVRNALRKALRLRMRLLRAMVKRPRRLAQAIKGWKNIVVIIGGQTNHAETNVGCLIAPLMFALWSLSLVVGWPKFYEIAVLIQALDTVWKFALQLLWLAFGLTVFPISLIVVFIGLSFTAVLIGSVLVTLTSGTLSFSAEAARLLLAFPSKLLLFIIRGGSERKLAWVGFVSLIFGFLFQAVVNWM